MDFTFRPLPPARALALAAGLALCLAAACVALPLAGVGWVLQREGRRRWPGPRKRPPCPPLPPGAPRP